jgi:hypothetical protein
MERRCTDRQDIVQGRNSIRGRCGYIRQETDEQQVDNSRERKNCNEEYNNNNAFYDPLSNMPVAGRHRLSLRHRNQEPTPPAREQSMRHS